ncbi:MAG: hypothetical protein ABJN62_09710 [Halioglobus sp.]
MITQTQSRVVRDATLRSTVKGGKALYDNAKPLKLPKSRKKRPLAFVRELYKRNRKMGMAVGMAVFKSRSGYKRDGAVTVEWRSLEGRLFAQPVVVTTKTGPKAQTSIEVTRHAVERVAERLETLDQQLIRDELAAACFSLFMSGLCGRSGWARCPGGYARIEHTVAGEPTVVTYISDQLAGKRLKELEFRPFASFDNNCFVTIQVPRGEVREVVYDSL